MKLSDIKGLKDKRLALLEKEGILTPMDLLSFFPVRYVDTRNLTDFSVVADGEDAAFLAQFRAPVKTNYVRKNLCIVREKFICGQASVYCVWYNQRYFASSVLPGVDYYIIGKARRKNNCVEMINPKLIRADKCASDIIVLYKQIKGLPSSVVASAMEVLLKNIQIVSFIPENLRDAYGLMPLEEAYNIIHRPKTLENISKAKYSISIEYLSYTICVYELIKKSAVHNKNRIYYGDEQLLWRAIESLPFELTECQNNAIKDILSDMHAPVCMNRLLQGDVGSGKTIVAFAAMYYAYLSGYQSVIMCPTEILAQQHYDNLIKFFPDVKTRVCLLHSGVRMTVHDEIAEGIASGKYMCVVGTHSVFSEDIKFNNLALVITDEQHRFGVNQRSSLENKTQSADCLVMSATPIPRTLALTLYGDLKQSVIETIPSKKAKVRTKIVPEYKIEDMWRYFFERAEYDERTFVVCPRVEESEDDDDLISCVRLYKEKKKAGAFVGLLHGKMSESEKTSIMADFVAGKIRILITTTVIEVGIDVPQAVNIAIYNPERYGLSQLHQLRGRVGRCKKDGYCFLVVKGCIGNAIERIRYVEQCSDGFALAEYDFNTRGAGDFLGSNQHGKGDMIINAANISAAKNIAGEMLKNKDIASEIKETINDNRYEYYRRITLN